MTVTLYAHADVRPNGGSVSPGDALAAAGGRVLAVGDTAGLAAAFPCARRVDLQGLPVFPGLIDAHLHLIGYGFGLLQVDLRGAGSSREAARLVSAAAARLPEDAWVLGHGWDKNRWPEDRFPTRHDLDPATAGRPAVMASKDGHLLWVNSTALRAAGITRDTSDPPGGVIGRDAAGEPDGILKEEAAALVRRVVPPATSEMRERAAAAAIADLHRLGITGVHTFTGTTASGPEDFVALQRLHARGELSMRVVASLPDRHIEAAAACGMRTGLGDEMLRVGPVKIFADGALGSQTASMLAPYDGQPDNLGVQVRSPAELDRLVARAIDAGLWTATHAIGDRANRDVLDVFERHQAASQRLGARHRIEHVQLLHPDDLPRLARIGVVASMQPIHATEDRDIADRYWGSRARWAYAWRSLAASGAVLAFGSDAPVETPDPWQGIYAAVTRRREHGKDGNAGHAEAWYPQECISLEEAVRAYTAGAAFAAGTEGWQGALRPGSAADFIVLDRDPYAGPPEELLRVRVLATVVGGRIAHAAGALDGALDGLIDG
ncbi:MAG: amidohydrolase [Armatimonadetes bacterium]|nr:amidohydrolase [Armatimonadota bacterium]